jgi:hypothetical protein
MRAMASLSNSDGPYRGIYPKGHPVGKQMEQQDDPGTFVFLDEPKPAEGRGHDYSRRAETIFGLLLLLTVIGWSLLSWRHQQQADDYNAGKRYAFARDWDNAMVSYQDAGDYADSADLARQVAGLVAERDQLYASATRAAENGQWVVTLQDLRKLRDIQPDYRDSSALYSEAEANTYTSALAGTVALRLNAVPAGLYVRTDRAWVYLPESDADSDLRRYGPGGSVAYDAPDRSRIANVASNPNLFATSVLAVDMTSTSRKLISARIMGRHIISSTLSPKSLPTDSVTVSGQPGQVRCGTDLAKPGSALVAYVAGGNLHVRTYDGQVDLLLEQDVPCLYDSAP